MPQLALALTTVIWASTFPATKLALEQMLPLSFLFLRFLISSLVLVAVLILARRPIGRTAETLRTAAIASVFLFLGYTTQTVGLRYTTASNSAFITALYVIFVPLFLRRFGLRIWVSAGLALAGLWFLVNPTVSLNQGDLLNLACAAAFGAHIACLERYTRQGDIVSLLVWQLVIVTAVMIPGMLIESPQPASFTPTALLLVTLTITGILATGAFAVQIWAQQVVPAQRVALI